MRSMIHLFFAITVITASICAPSAVVAADAPDGDGIPAVHMDTSSGVAEVGDLGPSAAQPASRSELRRTIQVVIMSGVQLFNQGKPAATARIYADTVRRLLVSTALSPIERERLQRDFRVSRQADSAFESARQLRVALDQVVESLLRAGDVPGRTDSLHS